MILNPSMNMEGGGGSEAATVSISMIYSLNAKYTSSDGTLVEEIIRGDATRSVVKGSIFCLYNNPGESLFFSQSGGTTITFPFEEPGNSFFVGATSENVSINVL